MKYPIGIDEIQNGELIFSLSSEMADNLAYTRERLRSAGWSIGWMPQERPTFSPFLTVIFMRLNARLSDLSNRP